GMAVGRLALQREEQVPAAHVARIHLDARDLERAASRATNGFGNFLRGPQREPPLVLAASRPAQGLCHGAQCTAPVSSAAHSRATVTSSKGKMRMASPAPTICPCS